MSKKPCIHKIVVNVLKTSSYDILQINMCSIFKNNKIFKSQELIRSVNWFFISNSTHNRYEAQSFEHGCKIREYDSIFTN